MTAGVESKTNIDAFERQFDNGGNGNGGNDDGGDDNGGDDGNRGEPERPDMSTGAGVGMMAGALSGFLIGAEAAQKYSEIRIDNYIAEHHILTTPSTRPAIEDGLYYKAAHNKTELGLVLGPMFAIAAIGAVVGHAIQKHFR